jgi:hypothetical protein
LLHEVGVVKVVVDVSKLLADVPEMILEECAAIGVIENVRDQVAVKLLDRLTYVYQSMHNRLGLLFGQDLPAFEQLQQAQSR